ncbi:growth factor receptor-bound protein 10 isoform X2 [Hemicordylus capensis]|uniref:growth factor receptor-bound protein 10 isoform X2 n=1 Tax=Hemicordylus capensis TaxID=884348 RepID=UPI002303FCFF|nr:growth factor receptor-bound protein 10 isoform X2 [Hemicordylus capensis]XP_053116417.1 growth factor receptor-bound protein 10 isoform X2 [Hemicordylus capensis]XP_053116418.1 growth factor receptor-bound protein 10 isoform X2 [Hemicordylus capensis]XP_053116420.1 growth factor receptor-bound protein 10 isoform X2 [Hemicordylus capensis]XP_053116421.1 growth factor receptor-bound protein 10 isoform X2 [Hemicordylus capensis]XP_053116422.1 growth factor receptor-bound protein 10 isoform X2
MALAGCPDSFLHHPYRIDSVDQTTHTRRDLVEPGFQEQSSRISLSHQDDDVDLEALVNDMNSSFESLYSTYNMHSESTPLLQNGQLDRSQLPASGTNSLHPVSPRQKVQRSQPVRIMAVRRLQEEEQQFRTSSLPAIPNPFPELCSPTSSPVLAPGSLPQSQPANKQDVKVFSEDGTCKVVEILADMTARDLCQLLVYKSHCVDDNSWTLVEHHPLLGLERCLEDHELVVQVESTMGSESKFLFRKNYAKYEFFKNPVNFFPEQMVAWCQQSNGCIPQSQLLQNFLNSSSCPEIQGFLHVKELGRKSWKKLYACLRRSGLYCSTKGSSKKGICSFPKNLQSTGQTMEPIPQQTLPCSLLSAEEPRHLQLLADLEDSNIFSLMAGKKLYNAPTDYGFCIKPNRVRNETKELRLLCAEDEQSRMCWMTAFRLLKYGMLLYQNYRIPQQRKALLPHFTTPVRSVSENSLVAMDFSGQIGRVIENPAEAQSAALEEGHAWRKRSTRMNILGSQSPLHPSSLSTVIHRTQHWFHGRISREESHRIIKQQGLVDGLFLLRDSQSNPKAFVLTLCHHQKIKHFQILPCEDDGQMFFSLDDGSTKFTDLIQLVEFYQLNKGVLPSKLKHHCIRVAL